VIFARCRQCAPHLLPLAHPSPNHKRHLDRFRGFCTAHGRVAISLLTTGRPFAPLKLPFSHREYGPHRIGLHDSLSPSKSSTQTASRSVQPFCMAYYCDRQTGESTDHAIRSVTIGRIYVHSTAMRPKIQ